MSWQGTHSQRGLTSAFTRKLLSSFCYWSTGWKTGRGVGWPHALVRDKQHRANLQHFEAAIGEQNDCAKAHHASVTCRRTPGDLQCVTSETRLFVRKDGWDVPFLERSFMSLLILI